MVKDLKNTKSEIKEKEVIKIKAPIVEALKNAYDNPTYQFHIPGHTKGKAIFKDFRKLIGDKALNVDTTDEFDNLGTLHPATGPIKEAQELAAQAFGAKKTFFLLNGSTAGNLALAMALTKKGQKLIANRTLPDISDALLLYNKSGGKALTGLVRRREAEKKLFDTPIVTKDNITYYPKCTCASCSIIDLLKRINVDSSFSNRKKIAIANGIADYKGLSYQNIKLSNLLKKGELIKP